MITADSGHHPNSRPQDFRLKPNFPGVISRDLLNAEAGQDATDKMLRDRGGFR
jgi:hypothetical protein